MLYQFSFNGVHSVLVVSYLVFLFYLVPGALVLSYLYLLCHTYCACHDIPHIQYCLTWCTWDVYIVTLSCRTLCTCHGIPSVLVVAYLISVLCRTCCPCLVNVLGVLFVSHLVYLLCCTWFICNVISRILVLSYLVYSSCLVVPGFSLVCALVTHTAPPAGALQVIKSNIIMQQ